MVNNAEFRENCGACHFAYQPELLPSGSWAKILNGLADHFGEAIELDIESKKVISEYLRSNAANYSSAKLCAKIMRNLKKGLPMHVIATRYYRKILFILVPFFTFLVWPILVAADDHKRHESRYKRYESRKEHYDYNDHKGRQVKKEDEGNEVTGQTAAWLLVAANLSVALSILMKGVSRYFPLEPETKSSVKRFNQLQKKYLMRFHYILNPLALCIAVFHFLLSSCRKSSLPEWGLIFVTMMVFLGLMVKFKVTPEWIRRFVYRLHTGSATFSIMIILLVVGHLILD